MSRKKEIVKFIVASGIATGIDLGIFTLLVYLLKEVTPMWYIFIATAISRASSLSANYFLNVTFVFQPNRNRNRSLVKYMSLGLGSMLLSALIVTILSSQLAFNETLIKIVVDAILYWIGFSLQRKYIF